MRFIPLLLLLGCSAPPAPVPERPARTGPLRVLYVEQVPRYEYRFLKRALLRDGDLLTHCLLTSADADFPQEHTKSDDPLFRAPLTAFPGDAAELRQFDVVILGDVDPVQLGPRAVRDLAEFVEDRGGGLILIAGLRHLPRALGGTPLERALPVTPGRLPDIPGDLVDQPVTYRFHESGRAFLPFAVDPSLPEVRWVHPAGPKAGATVLCHAGDRPLFVSWSWKRGRVFWSGTDETWLWRKYVGDYPWYYPFWRRVIEWAAGR